MQTVVNLKEIENKAKNELSKETFSKLRDTSPLLHQPIRMQNVLFTETQRKKKHEVCSTLEKSFRCYCSFLSTEDHLFDDPTLRKCVKILSIQWKRGNNIQKTYTTQSGPTRADITKAKHTITDPADNSKVTKRRTITRDTNKEIKVNGAYKKVGNIQLSYIIKRKGK